MEDFKLGVWISEDSETYFTKGHVDIDKFNSEIKRIELQDYGENRFENATSEHGWFKAVPDSTGEYKCLYHPSKEGVRGSFKATTATIY